MFLGSTSPPAPHSFKAQMALSKSKKTFQLFLLSAVLSVLIFYFTVDFRFHVVDQLFQGGEPMTTRIAATAPTSIPLNVTSIPTQSHLKVTPRGQYIRVGNLDVAFLSAFHYKNFPAKNGFNVFLNGWAKRGTEMKFKCCFLNHQNDTNIELVETMASLYHIYNQWKVDMQNAEFSCSISKKQLQQFKVNNSIQYVTFTENHCENAPKDVLKIEHRKTIPKSVGLCLKISYGYLDPELVVEWFEYQKIMGVTKVYSYLSDDLDPRTRQVFEYYDSIGFSETDPINPAPSKLGKPRGFNKPRWEQQAWVDEVTAINDCKHRMAGLDFVLVHDMDEFIVPKLPQDNIYTVLKPGRERVKYTIKRPRWEQQAWVDEVTAINDCKHRMTGLDFVLVHDMDEFIVPKLPQDNILYTVLKKTLERSPKAAAFSFDAHVTALDWGPSRDSPLHMMRYTNVTNFPNYDGADRNTRWAFISDRTFFGQNNKAWPRMNYGSAKVDNSLFTLIHRRNCKPSWQACNSTSTHHADQSLARYEGRMVNNMKTLPLRRILGNASTQYIRQVMDWKQKTVV